MNRDLKNKCAFFLASLVAVSFSAAAQPALAELIDGDLAEEQVKEKEEMRDMRKEMGEINSTIDDAMDELDALGKKISNRQNAKEFHLFARESDWETYNGSTVRCLTYNGKIPGPPITVTEGDFVKIVLHNQMKTPTSLQFHGLITPHTVGGIPRTGGGLVAPNETFVYQFIAKQAGTFWYHPQLVHPNQKQLGMFGAIVVNPKVRSRPYDQDITLIFSELRKTPGGSGGTAGGATTHRVTATRAGATPGRSTTVSSEDVQTKSGSSNYTATAWTTGSTPPDVETDYLINGRPAPSIAPIELRKGQRVRMRLINAGQESVPIQLSGHKLEIVSQNGGDRLEPHVYRDTICLFPSDRVDVDVTADNPGVWSFASESAHQSTHKGKFPGGMACIVRYSELKGRPGQPPTEMEQ